MSGVEVKGLEELLARLNTLEEKTIRKILKESFTQNLGGVKHQVESTAPVGVTGALRSNVEIVPARTKGSFVSVVVRTASHEGKFHAGYVEYGTKDQEANPYMRRAMESKGGAAIDGALADILRDVETALKK